MKYLGRLLLLGFVLVGAAGYCAAKREQDNFEYNKASLKKLAEKFDKIDVTKSDLPKIKIALGKLIRDDSERTAEPKGEIKFIPKTGPEKVVADFNRALNIVGIDEKTKETNIKGLSEKDSGLLKARLERISSDVTALTGSASWENVVEKLKKINTYAQFSVPSQTTPKAMFSGVNAISKAAESFFGTLRKRAEVEIVAKKELSEINENATRFVSAIDETIYTILKVHDNLQLSDLKFDMGRHLGPNLLNFSISLEAKEGEDAALAKIRKTIDSINLATDWTKLVKAIENKTVKNIESKIISKKTLEKIVESWNKFCAVLSIRVRLEQLAGNIKKAFDAFGKSREMKAFVMELTKLKLEAKNLYEQLKVPQLTDIANKFTPLISSDIGNVKGTLGGIEKDPIKKNTQIFTLITDTTKFIVINRVVDTFNESVSNLLKKMESWK